MLSFENLFNNVSSENQEQLKQFWLTEHAIVDNQVIAARLPQVVYIIRESSNHMIVGVSTAEKKRVKALNNLFFYEFRCFIADNSRIAGLDVKLSKLTFTFLEQVSKADSDQPVGIFAILENEILQQHPVWRRAVWPEIEMHFVGYTTTGQPIRVHYFKNVRI